MGDDDTDRQAAPRSFLDDLAELTPNGLRLAYPKEARSYARLKRAQRDGFEVAPPWDAPSGFRDFLRDMGPAPSADHTVDRIDPTRRRYGPGLCRWATKETQTRNRLNTVWVEWNGRRIALKEFAEAVNILYSTAHGALQRGETPNNIARRHRSLSPHPRNSYKPLWIGDDEDVTSFWAEFDKWRAKLGRNARGKVRPELFDAIFLSQALDRARSHPALEELTVHEYEDAKQGPLGRFIRLRDHGVEWIEHALRALAQHDRPLAAKLWVHRVRDLHLYEKVLLPPPNE